MRLFARLLSGGSEREALLISCHLEDALANNRLFRHASGQLVCADDDNERQERYIYIYISTRVSSDIRSTIRAIRRVSHSSVNPILCLMLLSAACARQHFSNKAPVCD